MELLGKNVKLRAVEPSDLDNLYVWENDLEVWKVSLTNTPYSKFTLEEYCKNINNDIFSAKQLRLMIDYYYNKIVYTIGTIDLFDFDPVNRKLGIGILIGDISFRKKGIASETLKIIEKYCFSVLNIHQIYCFINQKNTDSINLFKKNNYCKSGIATDWLLNNGKWNNAVFFQKINNKN